MAMTQRSDAVREHTGGTMTIVSPPMEVLDFPEPARHIRQKTATLAAEDAADLAAAREGLSEGGFVDWDDIKKDLDL